MSPQSKTCQIFVYVWGHLGLIDTWYIHRYMVHVSSTYTNIYKKESKCYIESNEGHWTKNFLFDVPLEKRAVFSFLAVDIPLRNQRDTGQLISRHNITDGQTLLLANSETVSSNCQAFTQAMTTDQVRHTDELELSKSNSQIKCCV